MLEPKTSQLVWKLRTVMSDRDIRSATELHRRLEPYGIDITSHQLSRIVSKLPARLNTDVLAALMTELDCEASDLLRRVGTQRDRLKPTSTPGLDVAGQKSAQPLEWKLHTVMTDRDISTSTELHRRLEPYRIDITSHQLTRIVNKLPSRLNTEVLAALMSELDCEASDLLRRMETPPEKGRQAAARMQGTHEKRGESGKPAQPASGRPEVPPEVLGPKVLSIQSKEKQE